MAAFEDMLRRSAQSRRESDLAAAEREESGLDVMIDGHTTEKLGYPAPKGAVRYFILPNVPNS